MAGLVTATHVFLTCLAPGSKAWVAGTSPAMTLNLPSRLGARARGDLGVPAAQINAVLRDRELDPLGEIHRHQRGDVGDAVVGAAHEVATGELGLHGLEEAQNPCAAA